MEQVYRTRELWHWLEPLLTDAEYVLAEASGREAEFYASFIPTGDHWS